MSRIALVTGGNKGIGLEIVRQLASQGFTVYLGSRDIKKGENAVSKLQNSGVEAHLLQLDVTDTTSIQEAVAQIKKRHGRLDILVNNAGTVLHEKENKVDAKAFEKTYAVNVFGIVRITEAALPLLRAAKGARVINLSSGLASFAQVLDPTNDYFQVKLPAYVSSKTAVNALTVQLAKILEPQHIMVYAVDPGFSDTDMNHHTGPRPVVKAAETIVWIATEKQPPKSGYYYDQAPAPW